ncbi:MAG TPA: hypothetical protein VIX12_08295 [Candidatus Binataceae bacterium]
MAGPVIVANQTGEWRPQPKPELQGRYRLAAEAIALAYIAIIATVASATGAFYVLFPELGALSQDVFTRPRGTWASTPLLLAITPVLAGAIGIFFTRELPYGFASVLLTVSGAIVVILALRSPVAPSISAGLLPLVLGVKSWWYPPAILFGTALLAILSIPWKRYCGSHTRETPRTAQEAIEDVVELAPTEYYGLVPLILFVTIAIAAVELTNLRFILFPPLVVIGFEMFGHLAICPWASRPLLLPVACFLTAAGGLILLNVVGANPATAALSMAWGIFVLRVFDLHVPPALAVGLLPMVMNHPTAAYPFSVGIGTLALTLWFQLWRQFPADATRFGTN